MSTAHYTRSSKALEKAGYSVWKVEQPWNIYTKVRRDMFNFADACAIDGKASILAVQVTDGDKCHEHILKAMANEYLPLWITSGGRFQIHAWRTLLQKNKDGKRGKREKWICRVIEFCVNGEQLKYWEVPTTETEE